MSRSFSGEEIPLDDEDMGSDMSVPLNDASAVCPLFRLGLMSSD